MQVEITTIPFASVCVGELFLVDSCVWEKTGDSAARIEREGRPRASLNYFHPMEPVQVAVYSEALNKL